jgi:nucleoside phosphorylase
LKLVVVWKLFDQSKWVYLLLGVNQMNFEQGLAALRRYAESTDWYSDFTLYEARLRENLDLEKRFGTNEQTRTNRAQIVDQLNHLAYDHLGISFNDLCQDLVPNFEATSAPPLSHLDGTREHETQKSSTPLSTPSPVDVGIVIALREEFTEFYKEIKDQCQPLQDAETGRYYYHFEHASANANYKYQCVATFAGDMGSVKAGLLTQRLISQWKPRTLVMLGIAAALSKDVQLGDVIVASQVDAYLENSKAVPASDRNGYVFTFGGEVYRSSSDLLNAARNFEFVYGDSYQDWQAYCASELQQLVPTEDLENLITRRLVSDQVRMVDGHLASGPTVGASQAFTDWLKTRDRKYLALEMEAAGLMAAVYEEADPKRTLVLRAISDFGDERKGELDEIEEGAFRRYAMRNAIQVLWKFFDTGILPYDRSKSSPTTLGSGIISSISGNPTGNSEVEKGSTSVTQISSSTTAHRFPRTSAFISYSHKDKRYLDELNVHLAYYVRMGTVDVWDDTKIPPGAKWREEIEKAIQFAKVAVLLVSAEFLASDFIATNELPPLLTAAEQEGATILSVILRPCAFKDTKLARFQAVNIPSNPLSSMDRGKREQVWSRVVELIKDSLKNSNGS